MILSRFWYLFLAVAAAAGVAAAILAQHVINQASTNALSESLRRDRAAVDVQLAVEARARLDRMAFISVDEKFGALLQQASSASDPTKLRPLGLEAKTALQSQVRKLEQAKHQTPDLAFALDQQGRIIAQLGPLSANPPGSSLDTYPLVRRVLQGYVRDDLWLYDRKVYRMAGRPVVSGANYVGAILHGYRLDDSLAEQLATNLQGAALAFFRGEDLLGTHIPEGDVSAEALKSALTGALTSPSMKQQGRTELLTLPGGGQAVYAWLPGSTVDAQVGVVVARPLTLLATPLALFTTASRQDVEALPWFQLIAGALAAAMLGLLFVWIERDRPLHALRMGLYQLVNGERERLIVTDWSGPYRRLADLVNQVVERLGGAPGIGAAGTPRKANLDEILGPTPGESGAQPFFGFATSQMPETSSEDPFMFASPHPAASELPAHPAAPLMPTSPPGPPPVLEEERLPAVAPPPAAHTNGATPAPPAPQHPPAPPVPAVAKEPPPQPRSASAPRMAAVAAAALPAVPVAAVPAKSAEEEAHFRQVFEDYIQSRERCGESIDNLSYEKFEVTLEKTRAQILSKHKANRVRFTVYQKQGKTALKAAPVRD